MGGRPSCHPTNSVTVLKNWRKHKALTQARKITHWPDSFFIHHLIPDPHGGRWLLPLRQLLDASTSLLWWCSG